MRYKELTKLFKENNIPEDVTLMSDSGWECGATPMDGVYYNKELNIAVFTQGFESDEDEYIFDRIDSERGNKGTWEKIK